MSARKRASFAILLLACWLPFLHAFQTTAGIQRPAHGGMVVTGRDERTFVLFSDIHLDPFDGAGPSDVKALASNPVEKWQAILESSAGVNVPRDSDDSNYALLASALGAARDSGEQFDYVLVTG